MDFSPILWFLGNLTAFITVLLQAWVVYKIWTIPEDRPTAHYNAAMMISGLLWSLCGGFHRDIIVFVFQSVQIGHYILFIFLSVQILLENCSLHYLIVLVASVFIVARMVFTFRDSVKFAITAATTGATVTSLMIPNLIGGSSWDAPTCNPLQICPKATLQKRLS